MAKPLKIIRTCVKIVAVVVSVAFIINSFSGLLSAVSLVEDKGVDTLPIDSGDFQFNYTLQKVELGFKFNNTGIYDVEGIILRIRFDLSMNDKWYNVLDVNSTTVNKSLPATGQVIKAGEVGYIYLNVSDEYFTVDDFFLALLTEFTLPPDWNLKLLIDSYSFKAQISIDFSVDYAFKQYQIDASLKLPTDKVLEGL